MTYSSRVALGSLLVLLTAPASRAQDAPSLDPAIHHVVSGGHWTVGESTGWYRAIVRTGGVEHVVSQLTLEWLEERGDRTVVSLSRVVAEPGCTGRLDTPRFERRRDAWELTARCSLTHGEGVKPFDVHLILGAPGRVVVRR